MIASNIVWRLQLHHAKKQLVFKVEITIVSQVFVTGCKFTVFCKINADQVGREFTMKSRPPQEAFGTMAGTGGRGDAIGYMELWEHIFAHDKYGQQHLHRFDGDAHLTMVIIRSQ
jgi:hypothetical protein